MSRANGAREAYRSLSAVMNPAEGEVEDVRARLSRPHLAGNVELKGVSYTFPGANSPILNNLSLKIPAGQKVAILGRMGSGKSTMSRLISGLIEPSEGRGVDRRGRSAPDRQIRRAPQHRGHAAGDLALLGLGQGELADGLLRI